MQASKAVRKFYKPPTPEERREIIAALRWWWFDYVGYSPHVPQIDFHLSPSRFRMAIAGTRGGKSRAAGEEIVLYLLAGATRVWIVGQNYALTEKEFRYVYERMTSPEIVTLFGGKNPLERQVYNLDQGNMYLRTIWGAEVQCISLDKGGGGALGEECDLIVLSEAAQIKNPKYIWERYLRGRLATREGDLIIPTTPAGKTNKYDEEGWLFSMYDKGYDETEQDYFTREWASWENPHFPEDPYELRRTMDAKIFAEQYEGKFMMFSGSVLDYDKNVHVIEPFNIPYHWRAYEAIDPGYRGRFVWLRSVISPSGIVYITDEYSDAETVYEVRAKEIKKHRAEAYDIHPSLWDTFIRKHNHYTRLYVDSEDPQAIAELTEQYALSCEPATKEAKDIQVSINRVNERLRWNDRWCPRLFITSNCVETLEACEFHSWGEKHGAGTRKPADDKWKHWVDCIRYIVGGTLISSEDKESGGEVVGERYWDLLTSVGAFGGLHPHDLTAGGRRQIA